MGKKALARSLDIGYGFTKFTTSGLGETGQAQVAMFPSYADSHAGGIDLGVGMAGHQDIFSVEVNGASYSVGPDAKKGASGYGRQMLEKGFFLSPQYLALAYGALAMMQVEDQIDYLMLGLPLNVFKDQDLHAHLKGSLGTTVEVPVIGTPNETKTITVKKLGIIPQIFGSVVTLASADGNLDNMLEERNLTIDIGYGTMLWMVSDGMTPIAARCGSNMGGVSRLLQQVVSSMDPEAASNIGILDRLDRALLDGKPTIKINGKPYELAQHLEGMTGVIRQNITEMTRSLGNLNDIDSIYLSGGGAHLYCDALKAALKGRDIIFRNEGAQFSNVLGYQILAEDELAN